MKTVEEEGADKVVGGAPSRRHLQKPSQSMTSPNMPLQPTAGRGVSHHDKGTLASDCSYFRRVRVHASKRPGHTLAEVHGGRN